MRYWLALAPLVGAFALGSVAQAQTATQDSARGNFSDPSGRAVARFDARSGPNGENATGLGSWFELFGAQEGGFVTCLKVTGNRATIGVSSGALLFVEDTGPGTQDNFLGQTVTAPPTVCPANTVVYPPPPFGSSAELVVADNEPADPARRMVGKGSIPSSAVGGPTASYAYILNCEPAANTRSPFEVRFGTQRFRLTSTSRAACGSGALQCAGITQGGSGSGSLTSGGPGTIVWDFCDGGGGADRDRAALQITNAAGTLLFNSEFPLTAPGPFPGSTQTTGNNTIQNIP